jgi:hypothetical protein
MANGKGGDGGGTAASASGGSLSADMGSPSGCSQHQAANIRTKDMRLGSAGEEPPKARDPHRPRSAILHCIGAGYLGQVERAWPFVTPNKTRISEALHGTGATY